MSKRPRRRSPVLEFLRELVSQKIGIAGLALLAVLLGMVALYPVIANPADVANWDNGEYWKNAMTPPLAPPTWITLFSPGYPVTQILGSNQCRITFEQYNIANYTQYVEWKLKVMPELAQLPSDQLNLVLETLWQSDLQSISTVTFYNATYSFEFSASSPPTDLLLKVIFNIAPKVPADALVGIGFYFARPDGTMLSLIPGYQPPSNPYDINQYLNPQSSDWAIDLQALGIPFTVLQNNYVFNGTWLFSMKEYGRSLATMQQGLAISQVLSPVLNKANKTIAAGQSVDLISALFEKGDRSYLTPSATMLTGKYSISLVLLIIERPGGSGKVSVDPVKAVVAGAYGLMGTDYMGRDLWSALVYGIRWALIIGLLTAFASTLIGVFYGMISAYRGGTLDAVMQRTAQIFYSIPVLPLLIWLSYFVGQSIWNVVWMLVVFGWVGTQFVVRSMVLQIKEQPYIEAAKALGSGDARILVKHVFPQLLSYSFASMALSVPAAILTEAGISFLGLGDPRIVTWGKILNEAERHSAFLVGAWWWVIPPGLMIAITALTFVMIGMGIERVIEPRLRT
ncbi:MAG: ABC transporter permease [Desulfurococcaceae archaeon]